LASRAKKACSPDGWRIACWTSRTTCPPAEMKGGKLEQLLGILGAVEY
jgi:hypothetical protein